MFWLPNTGIKVQKSFFPLNKYQIKTFALISEFINWFQCFPKSIPQNFQDYVKCGVCFVLNLLQLIAHSYVLFKHRTTCTAVKWTASKQANKQIINKSHRRKAQLEWHKKTSLFYRAVVEKHQSVCTSITCNYPQHNICLWHS